MKKLAMMRYLCGKIWNNLLTLAIIKSDFFKGNFLNQNVYHSGISNSKGSKNDTETSTSFPEFPAMRNS